MQRLRAARVAIVVTGIGVAATWMVGRGSDHPRLDRVPDLQRIIVAPGDDPPPVPIAAAGARLIEVDRAGTLLVHVGDRVLRRPAPRAYQVINGLRTAVAVHYDVAAAVAPQVLVGAYDRGFPLVIELPPSKRQ
jgi:hypothetical protein